MLTTFQWIGLLSILAATFAGGFLPLMRRSKARVTRSMALGEAFTAGVFLALSLTLMLPSAFHLLGKALPGLDYPIASVVAIGAFLRIRHGPTLRRIDIIDGHQEACPHPPFHQRRAEEVLSGMRRDQYKGA